MSVPKNVFASDNYSGCCPEVMQVLNACNDGSEAAYGNDRWCAEACDRIRALFDHDCDTYFVFNGTSANSLALASCCQSFHSIIVHEKAHVETDECGAPEFFSNGSKLLLASGAEGKLDPSAVDRLVRMRKDIHYPKPAGLSVTQSTELGTVYRPEELRVLSGLAKEHDLRLHMDGARFANALAHLGGSPADITWKAGVDVLCFGGTKQGMPMGEAVVFFNRELGKDFDRRCKQAGQLASKMRYLAAPWTVMLEDGLWLRYASHANACARRLGRELSALPGVELLFPVQANEVFVELPPPLFEGLRKRGWVFYAFIGEGGSRFVCSWACQDAWIDALLADARECLNLSEGETLQ